MTAEDSSNRGNILSGLRVVEVATFILAPAAATVMSDFGAEVIKVEPPGLGDPYRHLFRVPPMPVAEQNYCWALDARNKRSVALDLSHPASREPFEKLIRTADVLVTNYHPSVLAKLRLTYEDLRGLNERLIYASGSGYGAAGDDVEKPGYDMTAYWARSGLMDGVCNADGEPALSLGGMGDHPSSLALFGAVLLGLIRRAATGQGGRVSTSLFANGVWANSCMIQAMLCGGQPFQRQSRSAPFNPLVNHYVSSDGKRFILCSLVTQRDWGRLCQAIEQPELAADPRFATPESRRQHAAELIAILDRAIGAEPMEVWRERLTRLDIVWSPVATVAEVVADPQLSAAGMLIEYEHPQYGPVRSINSPLFVEGVTKRPPSAAPELGQHTREVLASLGYDEAAIAGLIGAGAAAGA